MSDQCRVCTVRGNAEECRKQDCSIHDSWFPQYLKEQLETAEKVKWELASYKYFSLLSDEVSEGEKRRRRINAAEQAVKESEAPNGND